MMTTYPCADWLDSAEQKHFDGCKPWNWNWRVVATEQFRPPKRGEWYLSGAQIAGYRAKNDMSTSYRIAQLVMTGTKTVTTITIIGDKR